MRVRASKCLHHQIIVMSLMAMGVMVWSEDVRAQDAKASDEAACKEEILESGEKACVRTRVISRRVVKRSSRPPASRRKKTQAAKKQRRSRFVVDPSAYEQSRAEVSSDKPPVATKDLPAKGTTRAAVSAPRTTTQLKTDSTQASVSSRVVDQEPVVTGEPVASFRVEAVTDVPLLVGAGLLFETRSRFRVRSSLGVMPQGYLRLSNRLLRGVDEDYPEQAQVLMEQAVDDSIAWRTQVGFRPFRRAGFYVHTGYTLLGVRGEATGEELIGAAEALEEDQGELMRRMNPSSVAMNSRLHMIDLELGWDFALGERANLRLGAGWAYTLHSKTRVVAEFDDSGEMPAEEVALFEEVSGKYLDAIYRTYVHPPSLSLAFGLRF